MTRNTFIFAVTCLLSIFSNVHAYINSVVKITNGGTPIQREIVADRITRVLQEVNRVSEKIGDLETVHSEFTEQGFKALTQLVEQNHFYTTRKIYETVIVGHTTGSFEVRNIAVHVEMGETKGNANQELVFRFAPNAIISDVNYAMEVHHYQNLIKQGEELKDFVFREKILYFLEMFRTAYNKKDADFIEKTFSDSALIIVGTVLQQAPNYPDMLATSYLSDQKISFLRLSKTQYMDRLRKIFSRNSFIKVSFDQIEIELDPRHKEIYGIRLKQRWNSSTYSDEGYLFLMMDFINIDKPLIHVRAWQPEKFEDGSTVSLYDFCIID